jgi:isopentenyl diphosphate isomerase/L-lactate dehydrogenase-like FMN-dependent dehydrogenase
VKAGLDFATLFCMRREGALLRSWPDESGEPAMAVLTEAVEALRAIKREEEIDLICYGGIHSGADIAKALSLGAAAALVGEAARLAVSWDTEEGGAERLVRFVEALLMETAILARCCGKTDVHNLEPEDLRALSVEASQSTGVPLAGRDKVYR